MVRIVAHALARMSLRTSRFVGRPVEDRATRTRGDRPASCPPPGHVPEGAGGAAVCGQRVRRTARPLGVAGLAVFACLLLGMGGGTQRPNVLLITVDTLRADALSTYGAPATASPELAAFAAQAVVFDRAIAAASYTGPSHASILTGLGPRQHRMGLTNGRRALGDEPRLAEAFRKSGYATAGFVSNQVLRAETGVAAGFDVYDDELPTVELNRPKNFERIAEDTVRRALGWLAEPRKQPFFVWVHLQDPHGPYDAPAPYRDLFPARATGEIELPVLDRDRGPGGIPRYQQLAGLRLPGQYRARYAGEVAYADAWVGRLLAAARAQGPLVVAVTADHGESLGEGDRYFEHGHDVTPELCRVPLLLSAPRLAAGRCSAPVAHVDLMPTLLELAGVPPPAGGAGLALGPYLRGEREFPARPVFCDIGFAVGAYAADHVLLARGVATSSNPQENPSVLPAAELRQRTDYRWSGEPAPRVASAETDPSLVRALEVYAGRPEPGGAVIPLDGADRERLRQLGYEPQ